MNKNKIIISVYGSHNAAIALYADGNYYVVEIERWLNIKNSGLLYYTPTRYPQETFDEICDYLLSNYAKDKEVDTFIVGYADSIKPKFKYKEKIRCDHHIAHAANAFYQSPYNDMTIFSFDGGGDGTFFGVYKASRAEGIKSICMLKKDLGFPYMAIGEVLSDIKREPLSVGNLVYAGKILGLVSYGEVNHQWLPHFEEYYSKFEYNSDSFVGGREIMKDAMSTLFKNIGLEYKFNETRYEGKIAWDIACTSQKAFENSFYKIANPYLISDDPIGMTGGCALNVLLNTDLCLKRNGKVFIPPNTNDCGLAVGAILWYLNPSEQVDLTYSGLPILDEHMLFNYVNSYNLEVINNVTIKELARYISEGNIIGVLNGNGEHGSRALGNRSILCSPVGDMKNVINHKVKNREWYRPFAPVTRLEDAAKYFDFPYEARHMTYAVPIKEEWRKKLPAVTHEDGTGRLQTVTKIQNEFLYSVISEFNDITGFSVLLNTSFNVNGKPILSTLRDSFDLLTTSKLDAVYFKNKLFFKSGDSNGFIELRDSKGYNIIPLKDTDENFPFICVIHTGQYSNKLQKFINQIQHKFDKTVLFIGMSDVCNQLRNFDNQIKFFELNDNKLYHKDRLEKMMSVNEMYDRLKMIWVREACLTTFNKLQAFTIIEYGDDIDTLSTISKIKEIHTDYYKNAKPLYYAKNKGIGILVGNNENIINLVGLMESNLLEKLLNNTIPKKDKEIIEPCLREYLKTYEYK